MTNRGRDAAILALGLALVLGTAGADAQATTGAPLPTPARPPAQQQTRYDDAELDRVVSPVALYPDPLLAQLFTAATFASQIPLAARWSGDHKELAGQRLTDAVTAEQVSWDPSVQAMLAFPTVLEMMAGDLPWTEELGDAFRSQPGDVMDAVQRMRAKAHDYGYLQSNNDVQVTSGPTIEILPVTPAYIVVPYYDPLVVYYPPRPRFVLSSAIYFGYGVRLGLWFEPWGWGPGGFAWSSRRVVYGYPGWGRPWTGYGGIGRTVFYGSRRSSAMGPGRYAPGGDWSRDRDGRGGWNGGQGRSAYGADRRGESNDWQRERGRDDDRRQGDDRAPGAVTWTRGGYNGSAGVGRYGPDDRSWSRDRVNDRSSDRSNDRGAGRGNEDGNSRWGRGGSPSRDIGIVRGGTPSGGGGVRPGSSSGDTRSGGAMGAVRSGGAGGGGGASVRGGAGAGGPPRGGGAPSRGGSGRGGRGH